MSWRRIGGVEVYRHAFLTSALEGELSASCPSRCTGEERAPGTHWIGGWVSPRAGYGGGVEEKNSQPLPEIEPPNSDSPARSQSLYRFSYPGSRHTAPRVLSLDCFIPGEKKARYPLDGGADWASDQILTPSLPPPVVQPVTCSLYDENFSVITNLRTNGPRPSIYRNETTGVYGMFLLPAAVSCTSDHIKVCGQVLRRILRNTLQSRYVW
jgi:hypothetical protein